MKYRGRVYCCKPTINHEYIGVWFFYFNAGL